MIKENYWVKFVTILQAAAIYLGVQIGVGSLVVPLLGSDDMLVAGIALAVTLLALLYFYKKKQLSLFRFSSVTLKNIGWTVLIYFGSTFLLNSLLSLLPQETLTNQTLVENELRNTSLTLAIFVVCIIVPIVEEILFRSLFLQNLFKNQLWLGSMISSTLFALAHLGITPISFLTYFVLSFSFCMIYMKTKSIECAMLGHMANNLIATLYFFSII